MFRSLLFVLSLVFSLPLFASQDIRCAFDIGSGETKVLAVRMLTEKSYNTLFTKSVSIPFKKSVTDGVMSQQVIDQGIKAIGDLKQDCLNAGARSFSGVATSGFRAAKTNGEAALQQISQATGVKLEIIDGNTEAKLGLIGSANKMNVSPSQIVTFDVGGGSMEFGTQDETTGKLLLYSINQGAGSFHDALAKKIGRAEKTSLNPMSVSESAVAEPMAADIGNEIPQELKDKLHDPKVIVVGPSAVHTMSIAPQIVLNKDDSGEYYTQESLKGALQNGLGKSNDLFLNLFPVNKFPENCISNLILVSGVMKNLGIKKVYPLDLNLGNGLVLSNEYWN